jgi:glucose/mannose-6-phosphate isomerase
LQPRAALGHSLVAQLVVLHAAGLAADPAAELVVAARRLDEQQGALVPEAPAARNPAKQLAERLHHVLPFVCSGDAMRAVATRFKGQLHENAETLAIASVLPEMNHNEIMAWSALPDVRARVRVLFVNDADDAAPVRARMQVTRELLNGRVQGCEWLDTHGSTRLERMLSTTHLFDFTSVYLAVLNGVDPTPVALIAQLKERLAAR